MQSKKSYPATKVAKQVKVAAKYKIDRPGEPGKFSKEFIEKMKAEHAVQGVPYMRVEYVVGKRHEVVEFCKDGTVQGTEWEETPKHRCHAFGHYVSGFACATALFAIWLLGSGSL